MGQGKPFLSIVERWIQWNIITGISLALALALLPVIAALGLKVLPLPISLLISAAIGGVMIGFAQTLFLRLQHLSLARWFIASGIGGAAAALLMALLSQYGLPGGIAGAFAAGAALGGLQAAVLAVPSERRAWIISNMLGWVLAAVVGMSMAGRGTASANAPIEFLVALAAGWALLALVLLFALVVLFPRQEEKSVERIPWFP